MASAPQLGAQVLESLARGSRQVTVDMAGVRMIDSAAIGVLLSAQRRVRALGGELVVTNACEHLRRVFALTGVERRLNVSS
jgi:anti-sigma B factor antagonist